MRMRAAAQMRPCLSIAKLCTVVWLFQIVLGLATGIVIVIAFLATCCIACCVMMLPYLGTVLLLPILVFKRSYSLYYFAQYGPPYDVFPLPTPPLPTATGNSA